MTTPSGFSNSRSPLLHSEPGTAKTTQHLVESAKVVDCTSSWRAKILLPPLALCIGWLAADFRLGQAFFLIGLVLLVDIILMGIRAMRSRPVLRVPRSGRVGVSSVVEVGMSGGSRLRALDAPAELIVSCEVPGSKDRSNKHSMFHEMDSTWLLRGDTDQLVVFPDVRMRVSLWRVECIDFGMLGLPYRRRTFTMTCRPLSIGPQRARSVAREPVMLSGDDEQREQRVDTSVAGGEPVLRAWRPGDRAVAIDWRRTERLDEMVVSVSEADRPRVAVLAVLDGRGGDIEQAMSQWAAVAEAWLGRADVTLAWREQGKTRTANVQTPHDIDMALAGAEHGLLDVETLREIGVSEQHWGRL